MCLGTTLSNLAFSSDNYEFATHKRNEIINNLKNISPRPASYIERLGVLRTLLVTFLVVIVAMAPFAGDHVEYSNWRILPSLIAPVFVPILFFVVLFDIVMSRVVMSADEKKERYRTVLWTHVGLLFAAALSWGPFFAKLF